MAKTLSDFRARHDPATIISKLESQLREANEKLGLEAAVKELLGTTTLKLDNIKPPEWARAKLKDSESPGVPTLFLSDFHWGEVVKKEQIGGVNEFNLSIAHRRLKYTIDTAIRLLSIVDKNLRYPGIVLSLGGDMISGNIHEELAATNEMNTMPTVLDLYEQLCSAIKHLADVFGAVFLPCVSGNHGRDTRKTWAKDRTHTSFDWLLYQFLARHFVGDERVVFYVPEGSDALYRVYDTRYLLTHGDQFRAGDSIIGPIGPLFRGNQKKLARQTAVNQAYDIMLAGHWHQYIHVERMIINGSLKGYDEYAFQGNFGFEPPRQGLWLTHPRYGVTYRMPALCEPPAATSSAPWVAAFRA